MVLLHSEKTGSGHSDRPGDVSRRIIGGVYNVSPS